MKAVDARLTPEEELRLQRHLEDCSMCRAELKDFQEIKEEIDMLRQRIQADALAQGLPESQGGSVGINAATVLFLVGLLILLLFDFWVLFSEVKLPSALGWGLALLSLGTLSFFAGALRARLRALKHDPYQEIDQ